jgi:hypothetical protein
MSLRGDQESPGLRGQVVTATSEYPLGQAHAESDVIWGCLHVAHRVVADLDGVSVALVLMEQGRRADQAEQLLVVAPVAGSGIGDQEGAVR